MALSRFIRQDLRMVTAVERGEDLAALDALIEAGKVTPAVDRVFPLEDAVAAMRYHESGRPAGKVVLSAGS
jgi:NADPH:quinone reductase-like Zn-dependent oxidoreductase